jgi:hypothetical protein
LSLLTPRFLEIPEIPGVKVAFLGYIPAQDFIAIIAGDDILDSIFYDNVRDWQDYNAVNSEMRDTLASPKKARGLAPGSGSLRRWRPLGCPPRLPCPAKTLGKCQGRQDHRRAHFSIRRKGWQWMAEQDLWDNIGRLTLETSVLSIVLIHLISSEAKTSSDTEAWLRAFADEVDSSIDSAPIPPVSIQASVEQARARVDLLMQAVRLHLARK